MNLREDTGTEISTGQAAEILNRIIGPLYVVIGAQALRQGGWTTQRSYIYEVAAPIPPIDTLIDVGNGVRIQVFNRPMSFLDAVLPSSRIGINGLLVSSPEHALIDTIWSRAHTSHGTHHVWHVDPDDIDPMEDDADVVRRCYAAANSLGVDAELVRSFLMKIPGLANVADHEATGLHRS